MEVDVEHRLGCQWGQVDLRSASSRSAGNAVARLGVYSASVEVEVEVELVPVGRGARAQLEEFGGAGQPAERDRPELVGGGVGVAGREDFGDPGHGGLDPDRVAGLDPGDQGPQPVLVGARGGHVAASAFGLDPLVVQGGVGLDDLRLGDREHPATGLGGRSPAPPPGPPARPGRRAGAGTASRPGGRLELGLPGAAGRPGRRQPVDQVQGVGGRVHRRGHPGAAGQRDLTQTEVLHPRVCPRRRAGPAHPADATGSPECRAAHARAPPGRGPRPADAPAPRRRGSQQATRVQIQQVVVHGTNARRGHRQSGA